MSITTVLFPIIAALVAPEGSYFESNNVWAAVNSSQQYFIENIYSKRSELNNFGEDELRTWVSSDDKYLNKIVVEEGLNIQFEPFTLSEFGSLSILDVSVEWQNEGISTSVNCEDVEYEAAQLKDGFEVFKSDAYSNPLIKLDTQSGDVVYMIIADSKPDDTAFGLFEKIVALKNLFSDSKKIDFDSIVFPCVDLNKQFALDWILGMTNSSGYFVNQALQQTKFKMDEKGAHVQSAVMLSFDKSMKTPSVLTIDQPFYVWIERPGCTLPIFTGYIDSSDWQKK